jgi:hypothetical protein
MKVEDNGVPERFVVAMMLLMVDVRRGRVKVCRVMVGNGFL